MNMSFLAGWKTYVVVFLTLVYAAIGYYLGQENASQAIQLAATALSVAGLRSAITNATTTTVSATVVPTPITTTTSSIAQSTPTQAVTIAQLTAALAALQAVPNQNQ